MRKVLSMMLALAVAVGMTAAVFAANPKLTTQIAALANVDAGEVGPGHQIWVPLRGDAFEGATEDLTMSDVKTSKIAVRQSVKAGSKAISSVEIKEGANKVANILVTLADPFTSTKPLDFETDVYLTIDGKRQSYTTTVSGTLRNLETQVYADTDYIDLSDGGTAVCEQTASKVEAYLGNGVSVFTRMTKGKQYYGVATLEPDADDYELIDAYPDIWEVISLRTVNLDSSGKIVKLDPQEFGGQNYYVYGRDLEYLGRMNDMLPYSDKYYLAEKKLDIVDTGEPGDGDTDEPGESGEPTDPGEIAGGDDTYPAVRPTGGNPDTGIPPLFGASIMAGGVSLAAMFGTGLKSGTQTRRR